MSDIEDRLERIEKKLDALMAMMRAGGTARAGTATPPSNGGGGGGNGGGAIVVTEADLDGPHGNPEVRFSPKRWNGGDNKGKRYSDCEPEFLDMLADAYEWFAQRDDEQSAVDKNGNPKSRWSRLDAARARGWAARQRGQSVGGGGANAGSSSGGWGAGGGGGGGGGVPMSPRSSSVPSNGRKRTSVPEIPAADGNDDEIPF